MRRFAWLVAGLLAAALATSRFACEREAPLEPALGAPLAPGSVQSSSAEPVMPKPGTPIARDEASPEPAPATPPTGGERAIDGRVVDERGAPVAGAGIVLGERETRTDGEGRFELAGQVAPDASLVAWKLGHRAIVREDFGRALAAGEAEGRGLHFLLRSPALAIEGRVVPGYRQPAGGWRVEIADPTPLALRRAASVEGLSGYQPEITGPDGRFRLEGLAARPYELRAYGPSGRPVLGRWPVSGGERGVELSTSDRLLPLVEGRVVDLAGAPLAGATARVGRTGARGVERKMEMVTGTDGRFRFEWVAVDSSLFVYAKGYAVHVTDLRGERFRALSWEELEVRMALGFELRLEPTDPARLGSHAALYDRGGVRLPFRLRVDPSGLEPVLRLSAGSSPVVVVPEDAHEIEVYFPGGEKERHVLPDLAPGETNVVRY